MTYNYTTENQKAIQFINDISLHFTPDQAVLVEEFQNSTQHATDEHYTFSSLVDDQLRNKLLPIHEKLRELDPTLQLSDPQLYHLTVYWCPIDNDIDRLTEIVRTAIQEQPLSFQLHGIVAAPFGISLKAYPLTNSFVYMRELLASVTGIPVATNPDGSYHERAVSTWIALARYTQPPKQAVIDYVNTMVDQHFGTYTPQEIGVYQSTNKYLKDPTLITTIKNEK